MKDIMRTHNIRVITRTLIASLCITSLLLYIYLQEYMLILYLSTIYISKSLGKTCKNYCKTTCKTLF